MSVSISLNDKDLTNLQKQIDKIKKTFPERAMEMLTALAYDVRDLSRDRLRSNKSVITHRLINSMHVKTAKGTEDSTYSCELGTFDADFEIPLSENEVAVGTNVEYAAAVEFGQRPHIIEVKNAKVLTDGKRFFGRRVQHPGAQGKSFLYWATKNVDVEKREQELRQKLEKP